MRTKMFDQSEGSAATGSTRISGKYKNRSVTEFPSLGTPVRVNLASPEFRCSCRLWPDE